MKEYRKWTEEEIDISIKMKEEGFSNIEIGKTINKTRGAVYNKLNKIGIIKKERKRNKDYIYDIKDVVGKNTMIIIEKCRKDTRRAYKVKSLVYPNAPLDTVLERDIINGRQCAYKSSRKIYEGNSLWSIKKIRPYIIDRDEAKNIAIHSNKTIKIKCPDCKEEKITSPSKLMTREVSCKCNKGTPYPELFFMSYNSELKLNFKPQQIFDNFKDYRFDFVNYEKRIIVETHGLQHFSDKDIGYMDYKKTKKSDMAKRKYCIDNNWTLIELDCSKSDFNFIKNSIEKSQLPNIKKGNVNNIIELISKNKKYPIKKIIKMYNQENKSSTEIGHHLNMSAGTILSILKNNNIKIKESKIKLPNKEIIKYYTQDKKTIAEIADLFNVSETPIKRILNDEKIEIRTSGKRMGAIPHNKSEIKSETVEKMYLEGESTYDIGKKFNVSSTTIGNILKRNGVTMRKGGVKKGNTPWNKNLK